MRIQAIEIVSEALCCIIIAKVACSASCRVKNCDDLERNVKMPLNNIHIFMSNRHISEVSLYTYAHNC